MIALGVRDPVVLEGALGRIHHTFISGGEKELRREMLGTNIYLLPSDNILTMMMGMPYTPADQLVKQENPQCFAVTGSNLLMGRVNSVEQAIRNSRASDLQPITADPMYSYAARFLPAECGAWSYENNQVSAELFWTQIKRAADELAADDKNTGQTDEQEEPDLNVNITPFSALLGKELVKAWHEICDFSSLPDFQTVRKFFGASVGYIKAVDEGIYFEGVMLKAPPE